MDKRHCVLITTVRFLPRTRYLPILRYDAETHGPGKST